MSNLNDKGKFLICGETTAINIANNKIQGYILQANVNGFVDWTKSYNSKVSVEYP